MQSDAQTLREMGLRLNGGDNPPELGISYGSRKLGRDVDLLFVFKGIPVAKNIVQGQYDLSQVDYEDFSFRLGNWDIEYTEPVLTGEYIFGNAELLEKAREFLNTGKPTPENLDYMGKRALETYLQAEMLYSQGKNELFNGRVNSRETFNGLTRELVGVRDFEFESPIISKALSQLTYTLSYIASRGRYSLGEREVTLKGILESPVSRCEAELVGLMRYFKSRDETQKIVMSEVNRRFENTKSLLIREAMF